MAVNVDNQLSILQTFLHFVAPRILSSRHKKDMICTSLAFYGPGR